MFSCHALRFLDCPYLFTCVLCVKIIKQVAERGKIVVAFGTVYAVINEKLVMLITSVKKTFYTEKHSVELKRDTNLSNQYEVVK